MKHSELIRLLKQNGWITTSQRGSHIKMKHPQFDNTLIVPNHGSKEVGKRLETALLKQAKIIG
jgi:predicted RNA binding protein YcfA (HicA-like mRNA interferase family)